MATSNFLADLARAETLPARVYLGAERLAEEREKIFKPTWQPLTQLKSLSGAGQFESLDLLNQPLVAVRGDDGRARVLSRVCRHRAGSVAEGRGQCQRLKCSYHGWSYDLTGRLVSAPEFEGVENWRKEDVRLTEFPSEEWQGFLFTATAPPPVDLKTYLGEMVSEIADAGYDLSAYRYVYRKDYVVKCNWKVYVDNYMEGYHVPTAHPSLLNELDYRQYAVLNRRYHCYQDAPFKSDAANANKPRRYGLAGGPTKTLYYWVFPNWMINIYPDNMSMNYIYPIDEKTTLTVFEWYVPPGTLELTPDELAELTGFSDQVQLEDIQICEAVQRGLDSGHYDRGRYSVRRENGVYQFHQLYQEFMGAKGRV